MHHMAVIYYTHQMSQRAQWGLPPFYFTFMSSFYTNRLVLADNQIAPIVCFYTTQDIYDFTDYISGYTSFRFSQIWTPLRAFTFPFILFPFILFSDYI